MIVVKELYLITKELHDHVHAPLPADLEEREEFIKRLDVILDRRAALLKKLQDAKSYNEAEQKIGYEIVKMDESIHLQMKQLKATMRTDLHQLKMKKVSNRRYEAPYEGPTIDGVFFDKKN